MKAKPLKRDGSGYVPCDAQQATHVELNMPGPLPYRIIPVILRGKRVGTPCWTWNGDTEKPTLRPSILSKAPYGPEQIEIRCHSFVNDGKVQFLNDCTHEFTGQTIDLLDVDLFAYAGREGKG